MQGLEGAFAGVLLHVAVQGSGGKAFLFKGFGQSIRVTFGSSKDNGLGDFGLFEDMIQHRLLMLGVINMVVMLGDIGVVLAGLGKLDAVRLLEDAGGDFFDFGTEGSREQEDLWLGGQSGDDFFHWF